MKLASILFAGLIMFAITPAATSAQQARVSVIDSANARLRVKGKHKLANERSAAASKATGTKIALSAPTPPVNPLASAARSTTDSMRPSPPSSKRNPKPKKGT